MVLWLIGMMVLKDRFFNLWIFEEMYNKGKRHEKKKAIIQVQQEERLREHYRIGKISE